jgi:segregation and condensation protein B
MSIENSDEQIEEVVGDTGDVVEDSASDAGEVVEIDADSLAAAAQSAGITDADVEQDAEVQEQEIDKDAAEEIVEGEKPDDVAETEAVAETETDAVDKDLFGEVEEVAGAEEVELVTSVCSDDGTEVTVESVVEAILFASDEPITPNRLVGIVETGSVKQIRDCVKSLNEKYEDNNSAFRIERIAGGYQMMTLDAYNHWLRKMIRVRADNKLTQAALETLAIVAYKQPIMRADVEGIRGVSSGEMIRSLMYKGLVRITGRAEVLGRPMLYGTTKKFLDVFGLNNAKDLPKIDELKKPQE